jgi:hypothetical protein
MEIIMINIRLFPKSQYGGYITWAGLCRRVNSDETLGYGSTR